MNDLLNQIDLIQEMTDNYALDVMTALTQAYGKSCAILEASNSTTDLSSFSIFLEMTDDESAKRALGDLDSPLFGNKDEPIIKRIVMVIPRLLTLLVKLVLSLIKGFARCTKRIDDGSALKSALWDKFAEDAVKYLGGEHKIQEAATDYTRKAASKAGSNEGFQKLWAPLSKEEKSIMREFITQKLITSSFDIDKLKTFFEELQVQLSKLCNAYDAADWTRKSNKRAEIPFNDFVKKIESVDTYIRKVLHQDYKIQLDNPTTAFSKKYTYPIDVWRVKYKDFDYTVRKAMTGLKKVADNLKNTLLSSDVSENERASSIVNNLARDLNYVNTLIAKFSNEMAELEKIVELAQTAFRQWESDNKRLDRESDF